MARTQPIRNANEVCAGVMLGPYRILECIGDGGMGRVYRAEHVELRRPAAIKFLLPHYAAHPDAVSRFLQEARAVNMVRHPNLVDIYDVFVDTDRGVRAYVMELLGGQSLRDALMREPLPLQTVLSITRQVAGALHAVHGAGIVHRDLKPENIHVCPGADGGLVAKVIDFGVAKFTRGDAPYQTGAGMVVGSPWYMSPEQAREQPVDARADVYSLGVLLYEMLTGCVPFTGESFALVMQGHLSQPPPPLRRRDGSAPPAAIAAVVMRCLNKDPAERPRDMAEVWRDLARAAGPTLAPVPALTPAIEVVGSDANDDANDPEVSFETPEADERAHSRRPRRLLSLRALAALSFAAGFAGGLALLSGSDPIPPRAVAAAAPQVAKSPARPTRESAPRPSPAPAPAAPTARAADRDPPRKTASAARSKRAKRRAAAKESRWSKAAFDAKRARAQLKSHLASK